MTFESIAREMSKDSRLREEKLPPQEFKDRILNHLKHLSAADLLDGAIERTSLDRVSALVLDREVERQKKITLKQIRKQNQ